MITYCIGHLYASTSSFVPRACRKRPDANIGIFLIKKEVLQFADFHMDMFPFDPGGILQFG